MPASNTQGGSIDPSKLPPGCSMIVAAIDSDQANSCKWAFGRGAGTYDDNDGEGPYYIDAETSEQIFGEEGGGYYYMDSTGIYYAQGGRIFDSTGSVFCGSKNESPQCSGQSPSPSPTVGISYNGGSALPPPRRNKECDCMSCGCDCNDIATMLARQFAEYNRQIEDLKDFIQKTAIEEINFHQKQLEAITIDLDLQPVVNRINEVESNLWNGIKK